MMTLSQDHFDQWPRIRPLRSVADAAPPTQRRRRSVAGVAALSPPAQWALA